MELIVPSLLLTLLVCLGGSAALTLKRTMERLNYVEDRINDESKLRRDDFIAVFNKLESMETMLGKVIKKIDIDSDDANVRDVKNQTSIPEDKLKILFKAFEDEKAHNNRFRREITAEMNTQAEEIKKAYKNMQTSLNSLSELLIKEVKNMENKISENIEKVLQEIDVTKQTDENLSHTLTNVRNTLEEHSETVKNMDKIAREHFQNTQEIGLNVTKALSMFENSEIKCTAATNKSTSCLDLYKNGFHNSGIYDIFIPASSDKATTVYCDMTTDLGGWTVFQRRQDGSVDFFRDWNDYKTGFGNLIGEFWLGNEYLHKLTDTAEPHELRIDLEDYEGNRAYAKYETFKIGPEKENYKLEVRGYTGNAGDSLEKPDYKPSNRTHNGMSFSTKDRDNDKYSGNCADSWPGGWWHNACFVSNLNGLYGKSSTCVGDNMPCIVWQSWKDDWKSLKFTEMKLRQRFART